MRASAYDRFNGPVAVGELPDPEPEAGDVVVRAHRSLLREPLREEGAAFAL